MNPLYHERNEDRWPQIKDGSLDFVATDPPYNASELTGEKVIKIDGRADVKRNFGEWDKTWSPLFTLEEAARCVRPGGWLITCSGDVTFGMIREMGERSAKTLARYMEFLAHIKMIDDYMWDLKERLENLERQWEYHCTIVWHKCLSGKTYLYVKTPNGIGPKRLDSLAQTSTLNAHLWNGEKWTKIVSLSKQNRADGLMFRLRSGEAIHCTSNHIWPTKRGDIEAGKLIVGDILCACKVPEPENPVSPELVPDEIGWLVGTFLADGSYGKDGKVLQFSSHIREKERFLRLYGFAEQYDGTCTMHKVSENGMTINIYSPEIRGILESYLNGRTAKTKTLSKKAWQRSNEFLWNVLLGYLEGDGHYCKKSHRHRIGMTKNDLLIRDLRTLSARLGFSIRVHERQIKLGDKTFECYYVNIRLQKTGHFNEKNDAEIVAIEKSRVSTFWDIAVEDKPHVFALASGILTHNSNPVCRYRTSGPQSSVEWVQVLKRLDEKGKSVAGTWNPQTQDYRGHNHLSGPICMAPERLYWHKMPGIDVILSCLGKTKCNLCIDGMERRSHPTQKPLYLWRWLFERFTVPGQKGYDPYAGMGTSLIVGQESKFGLEMIGSEMNWEYCKAAKLWREGGWAPHTQDLAAGQQEMFE